ncbi:MAG: hypothetical protein ACOYMG_30015 [Candidatus Methylumidiphilus sp.]
MSQASRQEIGPGQGRREAERASLPKTRPARIFTARFRLGENAEKDGRFRGGSLTIRQRTLSQPLWKIDSSGRIHSPVSLNNL